MFWRAKILLRNNFLHNLIWLTAGVVILATGQSSHAQEKELHFGALDIPPYAAQARDGALSGLFFDLMQAYAQESNQVVHMAAYPASRLARYMRRGEVDCTIYIRTSFTESIGEPVVYLGIDFKTAVMAKKVFQLSLYDDILGLRLGVARGTVFGHRIDTDERLNKTMTRDYRTAANLLKQDRVDAILGIDWTLRYNLRAVGLSAEEIGPPLVLKSSELWLFCSRQAKLKPRDKATLRSVFQSLQKSGKIDDIVLRYQGRAPSNGHNPDANSHTRK